MGLAVGGRVTNFPLHLRPLRDLRRDRGHTEPLLKRRRVLIFQFGAWCQTHRNLAPDDFFYPQRLWAALVLTMWMQLLLALVLAHMCSWAALHAQRAAPTRAPVRRAAGAAARPRG